MPVVLHDILASLERNVNDVLNFIEALVCFPFAARLLKVEAQVFDRPFGAVLRIIVVLILLDVVVRQVSCHVLRSRVVFLIAKTREALRREPDLERFITRHENVDAQIKLFAANKQWLVDVLGDDVFVDVSVHLPRPPLELRQLVDEENALALRTAGRFHDPSGVRVLLVLLLENGILAREAPGHRHNVHVH